MVVQVSTRIDKETKLQFDKVCEDIGVSPSNALSIFIKGVVNYNGIPFNIAALPEKPSNLLRDGTVNYGSTPFDVASSMEKPSKMLLRETARVPYGRGCMKGKIWMSDDFDAPLDDFKEYME